MSEVSEAPVVSIWQEREDAVVRSIMSALNSCNTLLHLVQTAAGINGEKPNPWPLESFLRGIVRPTMKMIAEEDRIEDGDNAAVSLSEEHKRQFCEFIASNYGAGIKVEPFIDARFREYLAKALPGHPHRS